MRVSLRGENAGLMAAANAGHARMYMPLHRREMQVRDLFIETGWSNQEIAQHLGLTPGTVKQYMTHVMFAAGVPDRSQLIAAALWKRIKCLEADIKVLQARNEPKQENAA